jgi:hypothetical protein
MARAARARAIPTGDGTGYWPGGMLEGSSS